MSCLKRLLQGAGSIFDLGGISAPDSYRRTKIGSSEDDWIAMDKDRQAIEGDLAKAEEEVKKDGNH